MLRWMRLVLGHRGRGGMGAILNGVDEMWHPGAVRSREDLDLQHQQAVPVPSPGDRLLEDGRITLRRPDDADEGPSPACEGHDPAPCSEP